MTNLTISLDENLVKQARIKAIQEGTSLSAKVRELANAEAKAKVALNRIAHKLPVRVRLARRRHKL